jgi:hypothetical protein
MAKDPSPWRVVSLKTLSGLLDVRSRPSDLPPGALRWRQSFSVSSEGKLCNRDGFSRSFADMIYDENGCLLSSGDCTGLERFYHNHDLHHQGDTREAITFEYESTASTGERRLFSGTTSRIYWLDELTGTQNQIAPAGQGAGDSYWQGDCLQDVMVFGNGVNDVLQHTLGTVTTATTIPDLQGLGVTAPHVVVVFSGFVFLMNYSQGGVRKLSSVRWSDLNGPTRWDEHVIAPDTTLAGVQDLDYGDEILAAKPMLGSLYIYTRRSIWKVTVSGDANATWVFTRVYTEPKNQTGCLGYPRTLVSTGSDHYYMGRESIYHYSPFMTAPEREEWIRRADGVIFKKADTELSGVLCNAPCSEYRPDLKEIWFSWPSGTHILNNWTLVLNIEQQAADVIEVGFSAMVNYRRTPQFGLCNEVQDFICASTIDLCMKSIGGVFYRQFVLAVGGVITNDLPDVLATTDYYVVGYPRILRGLIPLGFYDREKIVRDVLLDHDTTIEDHPCVVQLRIGNAYTMVDPNDTDDICAPMWRIIPDSLTGNPWQLLACPTKETITQERARGLKPFKATEWNCYEENVFLFWEMTVYNQDMSPAIGGDSCWERIDFQAMALPAR